MNKKIVIAYSGKSGTVEKCANIIKRELGNVNTINLEKTSLKVDQYDIVIIGGAVRAGGITSYTKKFIKENKEKLLTKKLALFICCMNEEDYDKYFYNNIDKEVVDHSFIRDNFGGELNLDKQRGFDKLISKMLIKANRDVVDKRIDEERIAKFVSLIKE